MYARGVDRNGYWLDGFGLGLVGLWVVGFRDDSGADHAEGFGVLGLVGRTVAVGVGKASASVLT